MNKKKYGIGIIVVIVAVVVGYFTLFQGDASSKVKKSLTNDATFVIFGYDNKTDAIALTEDFKDETVKWNPVSVGIVLPTKKVQFTAIFDGLEGKLEFVEEKGADGLIVSHFVNDSVIRVEPGSNLETYLKDTHIEAKDFATYAEKLFKENKLRSKFDSYKLKFSQYIESQQ